MRRTRPRQPRASTRRPITSSRNSRKPASSRAASRATVFSRSPSAAASAKLEGDTVLKLQGPDDKVIELKLGKDFQVLGNSGSGKVSAPLVFAGYGIVAKDIDFDEYKGLDVAGKIVVAHSPGAALERQGQPFDGKNRDIHAGLEKKQALAETKKALAVLLINDATEKNDKLLRIN